MVATPEKISSNIDYSTPARDYINSLLQGVMQNPRPDLGPWDALIVNFEMAFTRSGGNAKAVQEVIDALSKNNPALAQLMRPAPTLDDIVDPPEMSSEYPPLPDACKFDPTLARGAFRWLDLYEAYSRQASPEGYDDYHPFCGLWVLSVASARRCYLPLRQSKIYGNLMIALCGDTSLFAKSTTADVGKQVLSYAGLSYLIGPDKVSPAKLLSIMSGSHIPADFDKLSVVDVERLRKKLAMSGQKGLYFDELGKFLQSMLKKNSTTSDFEEIFLSFDACRDTYEMSTIARSSEPIQRPYLSLLGAMTPANLKENAQSGSELWMNGFFARFCVLAAPQDAYKDCPLSPDILYCPDELIRPLQAWHERLGVPQCYIVDQVDEKGQKTGQHTIEREDLPETACTIDQAAWQAWARYRSALKAMLVTFPHKDFHGSYSRLPTTALRIAVLMASLENNNRIELRHWAKAQELAEVLRKNLHELYRQVNAHDYVSESAKLEEGIINRLRTNRKQGVDGITVAQLKSRYFKTTSIKMLNDVTDNMVKGGILRKENSAHAKAGKFFLAE